MKIKESLGIIFFGKQGKQEKSIVSRFPLVNKKLLNFGKKQKHTNATVEN